jgi:glycosyltransferase involved in cell wall biosynthesis
MKIIQVNCVYNQGSTGRIVFDIHNGLIKAGHTSIVCYGRGAKSKEKNIYKISTEIEAKFHGLETKMIGMEFSHSYFSTQKLIKMIQNEEPNIVHLHCLNGNFLNTYRLLNYLKVNNVKTILTLHAEIMHTAGCEHAYDCEKWKIACSQCDKVKAKIGSIFYDVAAKAYIEMKKAFENFDTITLVPVSKWLSDRAIQSPILRDKKFVVINNGVDTNIFRPSSFDILANKYNLNNKKVVLYITSNFFHPIKGGKHIIELANRMEDLVFVIVGFNGDKSKLPNNIITIKHTDSKEELARFYSMAKLSVITSKRETFSMICAESLCCGTPIVGFLSGGPESISIPEYSEFVEQGDIKELERIIYKWIDYKQFSKSRVAIAAKKLYSRDNMVNKYLEAYESL